jgi:hypothetical protein
MRYRTKPKRTVRSYRRNGAGQSTMKRLSLLSLTFLLATVPEVALSQAGQSGLAFLKLGTSGRGIGMADAMAASVEGAAATYYNPAGMIGTESSRKTEILFTHREWIEDTRVEYLAGRIPLGTDDAIGVSLNSTTVGNIEIRTGPGDAAGTFTARNFSGGLSYGRRVSENVTIGGTLKFLYEKILIDEASGFGADIGARVQTPVENLTVGAAVANLGRMNSLRNESTKLPSLLRIGPAYSFSLNEGTYRGVVAADLLRILPDQKNFLNCGGEFVFSNLVAVRTGYQFGSEGRGFTAGFGVQYGAVGIQYAYAKLSEDLGDAHTISLLLSL